MGLWDYLRNKKIDFPVAQFGEGFDFENGTTGLVAGEERPKWAGEKDRKVTIFTARAWMPPGLVFCLSFAGWLVWAFVAMFGITRGVFAQGEEEIAAKYPVVILIGADSWLDVITHLSLGASFVVVLLQMIQGGLMSSTPFISNQIMTAAVFGLNAASTWLFFNQDFKNSAILVSVSLFLTIGIYWYRRAMHFIHMWLNGDWNEVRKREGGRTFRFIVRQLPLEFHHPEPIDDMEFAFTEVPLKVLLLWFVQYVPYRWFIYSMSVYKNQLFNGDISLEYILYGYLIGLTLVVIMFNVLLRFDGVFGFFIGLYLLLLAFNMADFTGDLSYGPSLAGYIMGGSLMILSIVIIMKSYSIYRDEYYKIPSGQKGVDHTLYHRSRFSGYRMNEMATRK
jgi:hypothetical protein